jgi:hypothetical protein
MTQQQLNEYERLMSQKQRRNVYMKEYMRRKRQAERQQALPAETPTVSE